jgi:ESX-1-secreted protein regulator
VATGASDAFGPHDQAEPSAADYVAATFAEKLERLFRTVRPQGRDEFTPDEVSSAIAKRGGPTISSTYIYMLRRGQRDNPTKKHLEALADFFGVPPAYFFDDDTAARVNAELDLLVSLRDASVRDIALRATGLSSRSLATIREVVERVRQLEGLEDAPSGQSPQSEL